MQNSSTINPLWTFSVSLYKQADVADYCIDLQEKYGALVNLVLFCGWSATCHCRLDTYAVERAEQIIFDDHLTVTRPIRLRRKQLSRAHPDYEALKIQLLEQELVAERQEQDKLYTWFLQTSLSAKSCCKNLIDANLQCYLDRLDSALVCPHFMVDEVARYCLDGVIE